MSATTLPGSIQMLTIHTGNILSLNDIKGKPGQNASEELVESIKITFNDLNKTSTNINGTKIQEVMRRNDDLLQKMSEIERKDLKIGAKLFINHENADGINQAILNIFRALKTETIDNLILSYGVTEPMENGETSPVDRLPNLKLIWKTLEAYTRDESNRILHLGVADLDEQQFRDLFEWAAVKPRIIQINLASCCVVPPTLQEFCNQNSIQLLTHSDPSEILPRSSIQNLFGDDIALRLFWAIRFQIHIKCRGVLTSKGYIVNLCNDVIEE